MKATDKLRANWRKDDIYFPYPVGIGTKSDAHWLAHLFDENFIRQAKERGYDIATFKFKISPAIGNEKFQSQRLEAAE